MAKCNQLTLLPFKGLILRYSRRYLQITIPTDRQKWQCFNANEPDMFTIWIIFRPFAEQLLNEASKHKSFMATSCFVPCNPSLTMNMDQCHVNTLLPSNTGPQNQRSGFCVNMYTFRVVHVFSSQVMLSALTYIKWQLCYLLFRTICYKCLHRVSKKTVQIVFVRTLSNFHQIW